MNKLSEGLCVVLEVIIGACGLVFFLVWSIIPIAVMVCIAKFIWNLI